MDDSDQDFVDVCSKPLKRARKKADDCKLPRTGEHQISMQTKTGGQMRRNNDQDGGPLSMCAAVVGETCAGLGTEKSITTGIGTNSADVMSSISTHSMTETALGAKEKVLQRMQQFNRTILQKIVHKEPVTRPENDCIPPVSQQIQDRSEACLSGLHLGPPDSDEALALRLQQELNREAAEIQAVNLEDGCLFFCHICQRDLSHMTPEGRAQHLNRCLDETEDCPPASSLPPPGVPECPICGKRFKSLKSRLAHLKQCSSDMSISPAVLLQALQRQAMETQSIPVAHSIKTGTKRKGTSKPGLPAKRKTRKKAEPLDDDTMMALALSSSLVEKERESKMELQRQSAALHGSMAPVMNLRTNAGRGCSKRKKDGACHSPPLLLIQDAEAALTRLQERVSALLLCSRAPSPHTPTRCPSILQMKNSPAPLWQMSALLDNGTTLLSSFYTPELREFITPWESAMTDVASSASSDNKQVASVQHVGGGSCVTATSCAPFMRSSQLASSITSPVSGTGQDSSQALRDLMELAEDGMTLTQCANINSGTGKDKQKNSHHTNLLLSGFILEEPGEQADLCVSGFLPETTGTHCANTHSQKIRSEQSGAGEERVHYQQVALSRLSSDLSSMVNNPHLSDVQLQVDSGDVYFAHSFMMYARCPLLSEMVHESGFGVKEDGMPAAQRVLVNDVPGQAVFALLQYLYTARCSIPVSLQHHVMELACRFDLQELQQLCQLQVEEDSTLGYRADDMTKEKQAIGQTDQVFLELLRSMWNEEDEDKTDGDGGTGAEEVLEERSQIDDLTSADREICEEQVNEEELEEIYEFAATQRKKKDEKDSISEEEKRVVEKEDGDLDMEYQVFTNRLESNPGLECSSSHFSSDSEREYKDEDPSSSCTATTDTTQSHHYQSPQRPLTGQFGRTLFQSSDGAVDDLSCSSPHSAFNLPAPGLSPGQESDWGSSRDKGTDADPVKQFSEDCDHSRERYRTLKLDNHSPQSVCAPCSPCLHQSIKEPELIVLSDSSEEMELDDAVLSSHSPLPHPTCVIQNAESFTHIRPHPVPEHVEFHTENKISTSFEFIPDSPTQILSHNQQGSRVHTSTDDCSPEVSWLVPSTPVQSKRSELNIRCTSAQTKSGMCRTQLFPKVDTSSNLATSPTSPFKNAYERICASSSPTRVSVDIALTEGSVSRLKSESTGSCSSSLGVKFSPKRTHSCNKNNDKEVDFPIFTVPPRQLKQSEQSKLTQLHPLSLQQIDQKSKTPLHALLQPSSSTPLQPNKNPVLHSSSVHYRGPHKQNPTSQSGEPDLFESPEKTELGKFNLSHLSKPSHSPSSCQRSLERSPSCSKLSSQSHPSVNCSVHNTGMKQNKRNTNGAMAVTNGEREGEVECEDNSLGFERQQREILTEVEGTQTVSFQQSFVTVDEPPMAFNDSWGFDVSVDLQENPNCCFSLRLEDSGESSRQESSLGQEKTARMSTTAVCPPQCSLGGRISSPTKDYMTQPFSNLSCVSKNDIYKATSLTLSLPKPSTPLTSEISNSFLNSKIWDSWEEEEAFLPLSQRVCPSAQLKTPASSHRRCGSLVPITPMPCYSDMDTPELKNKLDRFGVRPLPKRQMILKLKEIHQYTHQLASSDSEGEKEVVGCPVEANSPLASSASSGHKPVSFAEAETFKRPQVAPDLSPLKRNRQETAEVLSSSQGSNTSSPAASGYERPNPELCLSSDGNSDSDDIISASQAASRLQDRLQLVRSFIISDPGLYSRILQYQPLVLSQLQEQLKAAGIHLGAAKLVDYLDSQCITFTTAKPSHAVPSRRRGNRTGKRAKVVTKKRGATATSVAQKV
ncbi:structure-specific endonuclease subunit SLX4 isoform X2 [Thalassophryne amazonica]|uniref:structure-specific endonuclease subunit SLX4 isoform X2 n=1 Tax=Thalassophryne amazonica TaxID=390379 RepID=UPI0014722F3F|nr:structure-specific endonuclease subunit SLX4 isoform X2 [Thalassophryne amazonica]